MKHCPKCLEEYLDAALKCAECGAALAPGGAPAEPPEGGDLPIDDADGSQRRPPGSDVVMTAPPDFAAPVALALARAGIPALVFDSPGTGGDDGGPLQDVVVPIDMYNQAVWFCRGFEAAAYPADGDEGGIEVRGKSPV